EGAFLYLISSGVRAIVRRGDARLRLMTTSAEAAVDALRSGRAQIAVAVLPERPEDLEGHVLCQVGAKVVMPQGHALAERKRVYAKHLDGQPLVLPPRGRPHREAVLVALADAGVSAEVAVEAHGWEVLMHYAGLGLGVAVVNGICTPPRRLVSRPFVGLPRASYWLLHRPGALRREAVQHVHDALRAHATGPEVSP
ncbi:MAG: LysR family transcriptional regulator, partial [Deltaproteobacteria bacterium]